MRIWKAAAVWVVVLMGLTVGLTVDSRGAAVGFKPHSVEKFDSHLNPSDLISSLEYRPETLEAFFGLPSDVRAEDVLKLPDARTRLSDEQYEKPQAWVRIKLPADSVGKSRVLRVLPALFREVNFHLFDSHGTLRERATFKPGEADRLGALDMPMPSFGIQVPDESSTVILRLDAINTPAATIFLDSPHAALSDVSTQNIVMGIYLGLVIALVFYNTIVFRVLRQRFLIDYIGVVIGIALFGLCVHGYIDYIIPFGLGFSERLGVFNYLALIAGSRFARSFLMTARLMPWVDFYHRMVIAISLAGMALALSPWDQATSAWVGPGLDLLSITQALVIWGSAFLAIRRGFWPARFFLLAWTLSMVGITLACLNLLGIVSQDFLYRFSLQWGSSFEMLVFGIAIGDRFAKLQQEKFEAARASMDSSRLRTLVDMATHDIASPLAVIRLQADLAKSQSQSGGQVGDHIGSIEQAVRQQTNILNYIRSERLRVRDGDEPSKIGSVSLDQVFQELELIFIARAAKKKVALRIPAASTVRTLSVAADGVALVHSVLGNLLSNAIKFSEPGGIVEVSAGKSEDGRVAIRIRDRGIGIPSGDLALIDSGISGLRIHRVGTQGEEGSGIGLSLVRSLVEAFGGELIVESWTAGTVQEGRGTRITVFLRQGEARIDGIRDAGLPQSPNS